MNFSDIAAAALPADLAGPVVESLTPRWRGARLYMTSSPPRGLAGPPRNAAERFAAELRAAVAEAGGTGDQADDILIGLSGGYFWV